MMNNYATVVSGKIRCMYLCMYIIIGHVTNCTSMVPIVYTPIYIGTMPCDLR